MSNPTSLHKPYAVVPTSALFELTILADNGVPTAGDSSVHNVILNPQSGVRSNVNRFGPLEAMIKGRFTGSAAATADCQVALWQWDKDTSQWYATNSVSIGGETTVSGSLTKGSMGKVDMDPNSTLGYLEVTGIIADQDIVLVVTKVK